MRMETFIRKQLRMKAHWVTKVEATPEGLVAWVERRGQRRLRCGECGRPARQVLRRDPARSWRHLPLGSEPCALVYQPHRVRCLRCGIPGGASPLGRALESGHPRSESGHRAADPAAELA